MSEELFNLPPSMPSALDAARARLSKAQVEFDVCDMEQDEFGDPMPSEVVQELRHAKRALARLESDEIQRRQG